MAAPRPKRSPHRQDSKILTYAMLATSSSSKLLGRNKKNTNIGCAVAKNTTQTKMQTKIRGASGATGTRETSPPPPPPPHRSCWVAIKKIKYWLRRGQKYNENKNANKNTTCVRCNGDEGDLASSSLLSSNVRCGRRGMRDTSPPTHCQ